MRFALVVATAGFLAGCQGWYQGDETSPFFLPPVGSTLVLNQGLTVPPEKTSVYLQDGKVVESFWRVNVYYPYCKFELRTRRPNAQTVAPDDFIVTRVARYTSFTPSARRDTRLASSAGMIKVQVDGEDGGMTLLSYLTELYLRSDRQPDVYRVACQRWDYPATGEHLSIADVRRALGTLFALRLSGAAS